MPAKGVIMQTIIIGAGILGASTAFHLAAAGATVTIVDANLDGRATAAGAGIICPWVSGAEDAAFMRLYTGGGEYYPDLIGHLAETKETETGYRRSGAMLVSADTSELDWLERMAGSRRVEAMGAITRLDAHEARRAFPPLRHDFGGVHIERGARVDGRMLTAALLRAAERLGVKRRNGHARPVVTSGRSVGVEIDGEPVAADTVILTAGAWGDAVLRAIGGRLPVEPQRGQIVHLHLPEQDTRGWPVILPPGSHYIVPFDGGRVVVGATRETGAGFDYRVTAAGQHEVLTEALNIAPGLGEASLVETRIGFRPATAGIRPMLGWVPGIEGLALGNGLGAAGLTIGPFGGRLLADLVLGRTPAIDLAPFSLGVRREGGEAVALR
jgi:D-amino-acid dehydrogenase